MDEKWMNLCSFQLHPSFRCFVQIYGSTDSTGSTVHESLTMLA